MLPSSGRAGSNGRLAPASCRSSRSRSSVRKRMRPGNATVLRELSILSLSITIQGAVRIAIVTTSWPSFEGDPSGHFVRAEARELERQGHDVVVVAPAPGEAFGWPGAAARMRERPARAIEAVRWVVATRGRLQGMRVD